MLDEFFKIVGGDVKSNLFWASIGAFIGFLMPKIFGLLSNPSISWYEKYRTSKTIQNLKVTEEELQVEVLSTANEPYKPDSIDVSQQIPIKFLLPKGTFTYWPILILISSEI